MNFKSGVKWGLAGCLLATTGVLAAGCGASVAQDCNDTLAITNKCSGATMVTDVGTCCSDIAAMSLAGGCDEKAKAYYECLLGEPNLCDGSADTACAEQQASFEACKLAWCGSHDDAGCKQCI